MICDSERKIREKAVNLILNCDRTKTRKFCVPKINFDSNNYTELINFKYVSCPFLHLLEVIQMRT